MLFRGLMVTSLSGSMDGITASHNRGGAYFRSRTIPVDPATVNQGYCRSAMTAAASAWNAMTTPERQAWEAYAANYTISNRIGARVSIGGRDAFCQHFLPQLMKNYALDAGAPTPPTEPPALPALDFPSPPRIAIASETTLNLYWPSPMGWENQPADAGQTGIILHVSPARSTAVNWFKGPYIPAFWLESDEDTPPTSPHTCNTGDTTPTVVPAFANGSRYFWTMRLFQENHANGRRFTGFIDATF